VQESSTGCDGSVAFMPEQSVACETTGAPEPLTSDRTGPAWHRLSAV
jgi:hypothetical protein